MTKPGTAIWIVQPRGTNEPPVVYTNLASLFGALKEGRVFDVYSVGTVDFSTDEIFTSFIISEQEVRQIAAAHFALKV